MVHTNKILFYFLSLMYLSFYLLSPFFHLHEEIDHIHNTSNYHSHFFEEKISNNYITPSNQLFDHSENQDNSNYVSFTFVINTQKTISNLYQYRISYFLLSFNISQHEFKTNFPAIFLNQNILWGKYVHSASNISPPYQILA